jgi:branched-chain amino acid transport system ATP-binding protein
MLEVKDIVMDFGGVRALDNATFTAERGVITGLIGPNGAGKTTMFDVIFGFLKPTSGKVLFNGKRIDGLEPHTVARMGIGRTFQIIRIFPKMTVLENVLCGAQNHPGEGVVMSLLPFGWGRGRKKEVNKRPSSLRKITEALGKAGAREREAKVRAKELLELVGLKGKMKEKAGVLSYGEQKMLEFARALMVEPEFLFLDEPMAGLNVETKQYMGRLLVDFKKKGKGILIIEHDMGAVMSISDRLVVLNFGKVIATGTPQEMQNDPLVVEAYLGEGAEEAKDAGAA